MQSSIAELDEAEDLNIGESPETFVDRLKMAITLVGNASALAKRANISQSGLQRYLNGGEPTRKILIALAEAANVSLLWLMTGEGMLSDKPATPTTLTRLPLFNANDVPRKEGLLALNGKLSGLAFCRAWLGQHGLDAKELSALYVCGNSMEPTIRNGDTILMDQAQVEISDGDLFVIKDSGALMIKRMQRQLGNRVRMLSDNPNYAVSDASTSEIEVVGKIVWRGSLL
ncbi:XRE family transcriptional regulator [Caballeronia sp. DA-9]|uniref:XRE family transcriptional regulator n=1 Tax=Caballeronia sp. DA-9 TaxID=3436237 RepID=UPI003F66ACD0